MLWFVSDPVSKLDTWIQKSQKPEPTERYSDNMYKQNMTQWKQKTLVAAASLALAGISFDASALALGEIGRAHV